MNNNILLKEKISIYDNQAKSGESSGRLNIAYHVYPAPAIFWEFESLDKNNPVPLSENGVLVLPFEGNNLFLPTALFGKIYKEDPSLESLGYITSGSTEKVIVGDKEKFGKSFNFYLPNVKFQQIGMLGKYFVVKETSYKKNITTPIMWGNWREGYLEANIGNEFKLSLYTPNEAINWLRSSMSTGTYITSIGNLEMKNDEISISDAVGLLEDIAYLLSFANGGFVAPLVVTMNPEDFEQKYPIQYTAHLVDAVEHIGVSWLHSESDVPMFINCLPAFQKMLKTPQWLDSFSIVLMWYFQAIQSQGVQLVGKPWPVVANALGAAIEKLASIILVEELNILSEKEFNNIQIWHLENKIQKLLESIGIDEQCPVYEDKNAIWWFKELRNDATHPKSKHNWTEEKINVIQQNATQWVEEVILWRLGYQGKYRDRFRGENFSTLPLYKLDLRDASW